MDDVLRSAAEDAARIAVLPRKTEPGAEPWIEPYDTPALRQANVAATANATAMASIAATADAVSRDNATGRTGTGNATGFGGHSRALEAAAKLFLDDDR